MTRALVAVLLVLTACGRVGFGERSAASVPDGGGGDGGGGGGFAKDPRGFWIATAIRVTGASTDRLRSDLVGGARSDLTVTDGASLTLGYRAIVLAGSLLDGADNGSGTVTGDASTWVLDNGIGAIGAYVATWTDADHVSLAYDADDPRDAGTVLVARFDLARSTPPNPALVKDWALSNFQSAGGPELIENLCTNVPSNDDFEIETGTVEISSLFLVELSAMVQHFPGLRCQGAPTEIDTDTLSIYLEEDSGMFLGWGNEVTNGNTVGSYATGGTVTPTDVGFELTITSCLPSAICGQGAQSIGLGD